MERLARLQSGDARHLPSTDSPLEQLVRAVLQERNVVDEVDERDLGTIQSGRTTVVMQIVGVVKIVQVANTVIACCWIDCPRQGVSRLKLQVIPNLTVDLSLESI